MYPEPSIRDRIHLFPKLPNDAYCALLTSMDMMIDSYPFGGCNTSLDSFYLNRMVVTRPSLKLNGRFTTGFYKCMEIKDPIAETYNDWVEKSIHYACNVESRQQVVDQIRQKKSRLFRETASRTEWEDVVRNKIE